MNIDHIHLRRMDLNLLLAFDALMDQQSVSKAADCLGIGQSAMSHALRRLRDLLEDDLLVRDGGRLVPTEAATTLWRPVRRALHDLQQGLETARTFNPAEESRAFSLSVPDYVAAIAVPKLVRQTHLSAPGITYRVESMGRSDALDGLYDGTIDVMIGVAKTPEWAIAEHYFSDGFATLFDPEVREHPPSDIESFCRAPHVLASLAPSFSGWVDDALAKQDRSRDVVFSAARFGDAAACVAGSDMLLTLPSTAARYYAQLFGLGITVPPLDAPRFEVCIFRRKRSQGAPASEWLVSMLHEAAAAIRTEPLTPPTNWDARQ